MENKFSFMKCSIVNNVLKCVGWMSPPDCANRYKVLIEYVLGKEPKTTILYPKIEPSKHIHMYKDHSLCLSYPFDLKWTENSTVADLTPPWLAEWIIYYEIYMLNGNIWEGPESPAHLTEATKNINVDSD
ncbi:hypothetical protein [Pedobacter borealis]|uniref:hypothetical protein n=1 Tax=Pedobacter borealis TaxID=475254 RepID=UPI0012FC53E2|nr:hypothetical protein [Pedobacter borealis]